MARIHEELYKKDLLDPDNHDGVITHLEPDILECEVKWALGSITTNKASGGDGIPAELFQVLIDGAVKVLHSVLTSLMRHSGPMSERSTWPEARTHCLGGQFSVHLSEYRLRNCQD